MPNRKTIEKRDVGTWGEETIAPGETKNIKLTTSESYSGMNVRIPIQVRRASEVGPTVFVTAALHGDEINGTGAIRQLLHSGDLDLKRGALVLVPVLNMLAFDRHSRYLPDRRDLNRCFPGSPDGSLASRMAHNVFQQLVARSDYGIDLHTAAIRRTNYPNVRGDLTNPEVARIARAFGCELILDTKGPPGSLRREASEVGCATMIMEGGEVWKVEPGIVSTIIHGIENVLRELRMIDGEPSIPRQQTILDASKWLRAERGGFLQFHVKPGELVEKEQPIATNTSLLGVERNSLVAPFDGVVIGMTTLPSVAPGEPVVHLGKLPKSMRLERMNKQRQRNDGAEEGIIEQLSTNVMVVEKQDE